MTIIETAKKRGSSANTKLGAWRFLLANLPNAHAGLSIVGTGRTRHSSSYDYSAYNYVAHWSKPGNGLGPDDPRLIPARTAYYQYHWQVRAERGAETLCKLHGLLNRYDNSQALIAQGIYSEDALMPWHIRYRSLAPATIGAITDRTYTLATLPRTPQDYNDADYYLYIADRVIRISRRDSASWDNKKSKWPTSSSVTRTATLLRQGWDDLSARGLLAMSSTPVMNSYSPLMPSDIVQANTDRSITYEARGNWLLSIIADLLGINPERQRGLSHIQLDPHYRINPLRKIASVEIWTRTLAGQIMDYCAVRGKDTYHAETPRAAVRGLAAKLAAPGSRREVLDMAYALSLGFCRTGVEQFCEDNNLDYSASYSRQDLVSVVRKNLTVNMDKYSRELDKAGILKAEEVAA